MLTQTNMPTNLYWLHNRCVHQSTYVYKEINKSVILETFVTILSAQSSVLWNWNRNSINRPPVLLKGSTAFLLHALIVNIPASSISSRHRSGDISSTSTSSVFPRDNALSVAERVLNLWRHQGARLHSIRCNRAVHVEYGKWNRMKRRLLPRVYRGFCSFFDDASKIVPSTVLIKFHLWRELKLTSLLKL